tara:strand:+ start:1374 stop:1895 length:522 start_codon:yes stop_codon:yes gene_type:complete
MENSPFPSDHAFKRMKKEKIIQFVKKMDEGFNNLHGELSVALAERDQADESNQRLDEHIKILQAEVSRLEEKNLINQSIENGFYQKQVKEAMETLKKLNEFNRDPNWSEITKFFKVELDFHNEEKLNYQNVIDHIKDLEQECFHKNEWNEEQGGEINKLKDTINQMKQLLSLS